MIPLEVASSGAGSCSGLCECGGGGGGDLGSGLGLAARGVKGFVEEKPLRCL